MLLKDDVWSVPQNPLCCLSDGPWIEHMCLPEWHDSLRRLLLKWHFAVVKPRRSHGAQCQEPWYCKSKILIGSQGSLAVTVILCRGPSESPYFTNIVEKGPWESEREEETLGSVYTFVYETALKTKRGDGEANIENSVNHMFGHPSMWCSNTNTNSVLSWSDALME